jgi:hypothetical protein
MDENLIDEAAVAAAVVLKDVLPIEQLEPLAQAVKAAIKEYLDRH